MIQADKNITGKEKPLFLIAPLDWGLGHTTRMIPVINHLLESGCDVVVACNSTQKSLLEVEFPALRFVYLEGYNVRYERNRTSTLGKLLLRVPNILTKVKSEEMWFLRFLKQNRVDAVISDNRYGLLSTEIPCVLVTHQLNIFSGFGKIADGIIRILLYKHINLFTECWVPDYEKTPKLAGRLSHPKRLPKIPVRYMGWLSRFEPCLYSDAPTSGILIILSGPEPQRTILETLIITQLKAKHYSNIILIRGTPGSRDILPAIPGTIIINHADAKKLNELMCAAELIISRAGYTTVMDAVKLKKKMVVVPTPGQTEQEYLARYLSENNIAVSVLQKGFSMETAIRRSGNFKYTFPSVNTEQYKEVIDSFIASRFS